MKAFVDLPLEDQASIVLTQILEDVALGKRTMAGVQSHIADLFNLVGDAFNVPASEVKLVTDKVASYGVTLLPAYQEEDDGPQQGPAEGNTNPGEAGA
jgi:hypothetical protein